jgi:hypothetical protein
LEATGVNVTILILLPQKIGDFDPEYVKQFMHKHNHDIGFRQKQIFFAKTNQINPK